MAFLRGLAFILCWSLHGVLLVSNQKVDKRAASAARFGDQDQDHGKKRSILGDLFYQLGHILGGQRPNKDTLVIESFCVQVRKALNFLDVKFCAYEN